MCRNGCKWSRGVVRDCAAFLVYGQTFGLAKRTTYAFCYLPRCELRVRKVDVVFHSVKMNGKALPRCAFSFTTVKRTNQVDRGYQYIHRLQISNGIQWS